MVYIYIYELISSHTYHLGTKECSDDLKYQVVGSPQISAAPTTTFGAMCPRWRMHSCLPNGYKAGDWLSYRIRLTTSRTVGRRFARCEICPGSKQYAQQRSDGFYAPPGFIPKFPEPKKWYQRQAGSNFHHRPFHPDQLKRLRILVRLSEALSFEALNTVQDWFFVDLMLQDNEIPPTVGDLLFFTINAVGRDHSLTNLH